MEYGNKTLQNKTVKHTSSNKSNHTAPTTNKLKRKSNLGQNTKYEAICTFNQLNCVLLNADTLTNKMPELLLMIREYKPDVIMVNEVLPQNFSRIIHME